MTRGTRHARRASRVLLAVLAGVACGLAAVGVVRSVTGDDPPPVAAAPTPEASPPAAPAATRDLTARDVLRAWDAARATAWREGDTDALARLYTAGSVAGDRDVAMLRAWNDRGRRVTSMTTQVLDLRVLERTPGRLVLRVTDRLARVEAGSVVLPSDRPSTHRVALRRDGRGDGGSGDGGRWRVAWVVSREAPAPS